MAKKKRREEKHPREMTHRQLSHHKRQQRRQRIIIISGISIVVAIVLIIIGGWFAGEYLPLHRTVIQVFDTKFDGAYFVDALVIYSQGQNSASLEQIASGLSNQIMQNEVIKQAAKGLGINVSDDEAKQFLENNSIPVSDAAMDIARSQLLPDRLKSGYFDSQVPVSDNQVHIYAMMVESDTVAKMVREKIMNGENFTLLTKDYAQNYYSKTNGPDYDWHPVSTLKDLVGTNIPVDFAFDANVKPGDLSQPLSDNASYKQLGYWLIRVNERPTEDTANVSAIYLSSEEEALAIRAQLEAGAELAPIADNLSQYSTSQEKHGEMGLMSTSDNITNVYNGYVFDPATELGKWSQPLREEGALWTKGGSWLVQVVGKEENRNLSTDDRNTLINNLYSSWNNEMLNSAATFFVDDATPEVQIWAVARASPQL